MSWGEVQGHDTREAREAKWKGCPPLWINLMRDQSWFLALWETWATCLKTKNSWNNMRQAKSCNPKIKNQCIRLGVNPFWKRAAAPIFLTAWLTLSPKKWYEIVSQIFTARLQLSNNFLPNEKPPQGYAPCQKSLQLRIRPKTASGSSSNRASSAALKIGKCLGKIHRVVRSKAIFSSSDVFA